MGQTTESTTIKQKIKLLPEHLIDQIKAGEVIERPASIVKELVENAVDAGSSRIDIQIIDNGLELISVSDDGKGMSFEDLPFAFCRHATSKLEKFEDIYNLFTYGFRGEALASMASIARVNCVSNPEEAPEQGGKIELHGAKQVAHVPFSARKSGTAIYVRDLFYNTPARLKFIKSKTSEKNALLRIIHSFILSNPGITFSVKIDDNDKELFPTIVEEMNYKRVSQVFFKKVVAEDELYFFEHEYEGMKIKAWFSKEGKKGAGKSQYLFANKRLFNDKQIHGLICRKMEKLWGFHESGNYVVELEVPANDIDVNVHPNKTQIKFFKSSQVFSLVAGGIDQLAEKNKVAISNLPATGYDSSWSRPEESTDSNRFGFSARYLETSGDSLTRLSDGYWHITRDNKNWIIDLDLMIKTFLVQCLASYPHLPEKDVIPLLICEPFNNKEMSDASLSFFKRKGIEWERIDKETLVLKTIPFWMEALPLQTVLGPLLEKFSNTPEEEELLKGVNRLSFPVIGSITSNQIEKMWAILDEKLPNNQEFARQLNDDLLSRIFSDT